MQRRPRSAELATLRHRWRRWTAVVEMFARRRRARRRVSPRQYQLLRDQLLAACRSLAAEGPDGGYYRDLQNLVQPWLTCGALEQADGEILAGLLGRCRQVERELGGPAWVSAAGRWAAWGLVVLAAAAVPVLLVVAANAVGMPLGEQVGGWWRLLDHAVRNASDAQRWVAVGFVAVLVGMYLASRTSPS
jgi:hypothetical protein